jgi:hypothetical protein
MVAQAGEIGIKSKTTRKFIVSVLRRNISEKCSEFNLNFKNIASRTIIFTDKPREVSEKISRIIFGVNHTAPIYFFKWVDYNTLMDIATKYSAQFISPGQSFGFDARSTGVNRPSTQKLKVELGSKLYEHFNGSISVNLTNPDFLFHVEVRDEYAWIYHEKVDGLDGYPPGSQKSFVYGNIRPWLLDYLASFLMMKRGVIVRPVRFLTDESPPASFQEFHQQFIDDFSYKKNIDVPIYDLLNEWKDQFGSNLCTACIFFSERVLIQASNTNHGLGFTSGLRSSNLGGDIDNYSLKWLENKNSGLKFRPTLIFNFDEILDKWIFRNNNFTGTCCKFQEKRIVSQELTPDEIKIVEEKATEYVKTYFLHHPIDQEEKSDEFSSK